MYDVMRDAWIMRARHAVTDARDIRAESAELREHAHAIIEWLNAQLAVRGQPSASSATVGGERTESGTCTKVLRRPSHTDGHHHRHQYT